MTAPYCNICESGGHKSPAALREIAQGHTNGALRSKSWQGGRARFCSRQARRFLRHAEEVERIERATAEVLR